MPSTINPHAAAATCPTSTAKAHLARVERLARRYPANEPPRRLARQHVLNRARLIEACDMYASSTYEDTRAPLLDRLNEAQDHLRDTKAKVSAENDTNLALVFQALLDIHLQMAVEWSDAVGDSTQLGAATDPNPRFVVVDHQETRGLEIMARRLVSARQTIAADTDRTATAALLERDLRARWTALSRDSRLLVVEHLAHLGGMVAVARCHVSPPGRFTFLEGA